MNEQRVREIIREELLRLGVIKEGVSLSEEQLKGAGIGHLLTVKQPDGSSRPIGRGGIQNVLAITDKAEELRKEREKERYIKGTDKPIDI